MHQDMKQVRAVRCCLFCFSLLVNKGKNMVDRLLTSTLEPNEHHLEEEKPEYLHTSGHI